MTDPRYHTIEDWDRPRNGLFAIYIDCWWRVDEHGNPLFFQDSPQCNPFESIAKRLARGGEVVKLPVVYVPINVIDYSISR